MKQKSFATSGFELVTKRTRKREFLDKLDLVVPWSELDALIAPHAPPGKTGRPPDESTILRFRRLLEANNLSLQIMATINAPLGYQRLAAQDRHRGGRHPDCGSPLHQEQNG